MMAEIKHRGPITCRQAVTKAFFKYKGGIFKDTTGDKRPRHATSILGWGKSKSGQKYWLVRNSWGTYWGENGFFKVARGIDNLGIEEECSWGKPVRDWKSPSSFLGREDTLVTTTDLGGNIDGSEALVQESDKLHKAAANLKRHAEQMSSDDIVQPVVSKKEDDHSDSFYSADVNDPESDESGPRGLADEDDSFKKDNGDHGMLAREM